MPTADLRHGDCLDILRQLPDESVHAVITDPPYGLANTDSSHVVETLSRWFAGERDYLPSGSGFMGKAWDAFVPPPAVWDECFRVLRPGGHLLCFAGTRTVDLMGLSIRLAGFDLRDTIAWLTGSGFPKSLNVSKDKRFCQCERGPQARESRPLCERCGKQIVPAGLGTALKPANEPCLVARKPLAKGHTVAANVLAHGTGALNIDGCRVEGGERPLIENAGRADPRGEGFHGKFGSSAVGTTTAGRWPTNVVLDGDAADALDEQSGVTRDGVAVQRNGGGQAIFGGIGDGSNGMGARPDAGYGGTGGASRFYPVFRYQAKAPAKERPSYEKDGGGPTVSAISADVCALCGRQDRTGSPCTCPEPQWIRKGSVTSKVAHPTVKPLALMQWLVRLVTPPGGTVLEPFAGSGTTIEAALLEGFDVIGIEREADYLPLIQQRIDRATAATAAAPEPEVDGLW